MIFIIKLKCPANMTKIRTKIYLRGTGTEPEAVKISRVPSGEYENSLLFYFQFMFSNILELNAERNRPFSLVPQYAWFFL